MPQLSFKVFSSKMAFITNVPIDMKNDVALKEFVLRNKTFNGIVTVMKDTKYTEYDGSTHQRHFEYEVENGKYRKKMYSNQLKWKVVVNN